MPLTDLPLETLRGFQPDVLEPDDFDSFWAMTLGESRMAGSTVELRTIETPISELIVEDLTFAGYAGDPVRAWITRPRDENPRATVIEYVGYGGGRGAPGERLQWAAAGFVHILMDTRGQGSAWGSGGHTPDPHGSGPAAPGFMTRGIDSPDNYYYRRVYTDGVRLVDAAASLDCVDAEHIALTGASQGGGIALAVAGLVGDRVVAVMPDVPFLSHFRRAVETTPAEPFTEITRYLAVHRDQEEAVFHTLSYFDGVNFARRVHVPALFSVALMDGIVLPSTVFAAYNHLGSTDRDISVYPYNGHEGGQHHQWIRQATWLRDRLGSAQGGRRN